MSLAGEGVRAHIGRVATCLVQPTRRVRLSCGSRVPCGPRASVEGGFGTGESRASGLACPVWPLCGGREGRSGRVSDVALRLPRVALMIASGGGSGRVSSSSQTSPVRRRPYRGAERARTARWRCPACPVARSRFRCRGCRGRAGARRCRRDEGSLGIPPLMASLDVGRANRTIRATRDGRGQRECDRPRAVPKGRRADR